MRLNVACNWDLNLPSILSKYKEVKMLYSNTANDIIGGGRVRKAMPSMSLEKIANFIAECHKYSLEFQYLITSPVLGNREYTGDGRKEILDFVGWLTEVKVDSVAVGNPILIELIHRNFPKVSIKGSVFLRIDSVEKAKYYQQIGLDEFVLLFDYNRDFTLLKELRKKVNIKIQLIANGTCLYHCPFSINHANFLGYASQPYYYRNKSDEVIVDNCLLHCREKVILHPETMLESQNWIRPEDISIYEEMGYDRFKITDRSADTLVIENCVKAYTNRNWTGNLTEILTIKSPLEAPERFAKELGEPNKKLLFNKELRPEQRLLMGIELFEGGRPYIENSKLTDFLKNVGNRDCRRQTCEECSYCRQFINKTAVFSDKISQLEDLIKKTLIMFYHFKKG